MELEFVSLSWETIAWQVLNIAIIVVIAYLLFLLIRWLRKQ